MKLGKKAAVYDPRNLKMFALMRPDAPPPPEEWDYDTLNPGIPTPMFGNDRYGCCVIAGRAHQTLRFESLEQKKLLYISEEEVLQQYMAETGGIDSGLAVLPSLNLWRRKGWTAAKANYQIRGYAELQLKNRSLIKQAMFANLGVGVGLSLPDNWENAIDRGKIWEDTSMPANGRNGHYVFCVGYNPKWITCVTWGFKQPMTWEFFDKYADEIYATIDATDRAKEFINFDRYDKQIKLVDDRRAKREKASKEKPSGPEDSKS